MNAEVESQPKRKLSITLPNPNIIIENKKNTPTPKAPRNILDSKSCTPIHTPTSEISETPKK
jgi:hypothetical protein